jgi:hypothetical protein
MTTTPIAIRTEYKLTDEGTRLRKALKMSLEDFTSKLLKLNLPLLSSDRIYPIKGQKTDEFYVINQWNAQIPDMEIPYILQTQINHLTGMEFGKFFGLSRCFLVVDHDRQFDYRMNAIGEWTLQ